MAKGDPSTWPSEKPCNECGINKSLEDFSVQAAGKYGRRGICRDCHSLKFKAWYAKNSAKDNANGREWREANPEYGAEYREANKDKIKADNAAYYLLNKETIDDYNKSYYEDNQESVLLRHREWREANPGYHEAYSENWYLENRERSAATHRAWALANPETVTAIGHQRRILIKDAGPRYTAKEWISLCELYDHTCLCCRRKQGELDVNGKVLKLTVDHIIPISKFGSNSIDNIQPLCGSCNSKKHNKTIDYRPESQVTSDVA